MSPEWTEEEILTTFHTARDRLRHQRRWRRRAAYALVIVLVLGIVGVVAFLALGRDSAKTAAEDIAAPSGTLTEQVLEVCASGGEEASELQDIGACGQAEETQRIIDESPVDTTTAPAPARAQTRFIPPSPSLLARLIQDELRENPPKPGKNGKPGTDGQDVTFDQVVRAVSVLLPDQIAAYCAPRNSCVGAAGGDGGQGRPGRGIADAQCVEGRWRITYTDETTSDGGSCTAPLVPTPDPTDVPTEETP